MFRQFFSLCALLVTISAHAEMIPSESIGNDPERAKLCATRANVKPVPFEIDSRYLASARANNPDVTFIASDTISPQLIECRLLAGSGKYGPASFSPEQSYWRLKRPEQFKPGINTPQGRAMAAKACLDTAPDRISRPNFNNTIQKAVVEVAPSNPLYRPGFKVDGKKAERYDIVVMGTSFYKSTGPDLAAVEFTCLLSPMLDLKAFQFK